MTGRIIVVTGASDGLGRASALRFGARGDRVVLMARRREKLEEVATEVRRAGGEAFVEPVDALDAAAVREVGARVVSTHGAPDAVVHSAGAGVWRFADETSPEQLTQMMAAPFSIAFHLVGAVTPAMIARGAGVHVLVQSPAAFSPWRGATGYACARWALRGLHEALRQDLRGTGVTSAQLVLGEITDSAYFAANPGTREKLPRIARILELTVTDGAKEIERLVDRPRAERFRPRLFGALAVFTQWFPSTGRLAAGVSPAPRWRALP
jgi:NAD(P)-dependent dehydrogenase (short-subunit alcohol dehydrogenase family)